MKKKLLDVTAWVILAVLVLIAGLALGAMVIALWPIPLFILAAVAIVAASIWAVDRVWP